MKLRSTAKMSIPAIVLFGMAAVATVSSAVLGVFWVNSHIRQYRQEVERVRSDYMEGRQNLIKFQIDNVIDYILYMKSQEETRLKAEIKQRVYEAHAAAENLVEEFGDTVTHEQMESIVREALRDIWFHRGQGYYFAFRMNGIETLFAERPELEGTDMMGVQDTEGRFVVPDMLDIAREQGEGYYSYRWIRPGMEGADYEKISFVKYFEPLDWVIGTGIYVDDMVQTIQSEVLDRINSMVLPEDEYIFIGQWDGFILTGPATGQVMIEIEDINGLKVVQELIKTAKQGSGFVTYVMPDVDGQRVSTKLSYTRGVPDWEWYVGTGVYIDEIETEVAEIEERQMEEIRRDMVRIISILLVLLAISFASALATSRMVRRGVVAIIGFFERASSPDARPSAPALAMPEFVQLADAANRILIERIHAEDERRKLEDQVQHTQRLESLGILAGGIAHDFNNLLQAILGNAELASPELPEQSPVRDNLAAIETASKRAADLCQQLLTYSGQGSLHRERIDLRHLVDEMSQMLAVSISKKIELTYHFPPLAANIEADSAQIRQVVLNLITNAAEAIGDNDGTIDLHIQEIEVTEVNQSSEVFTSGRLKPGRYVQLLVIDDGTGMDESTLSRIFDPFFTTKFTGRGLGLAAVLGIAKRHGGSVRVQSNPERGTSFYFIVPLDKREDVTQTAVPIAKADANGVGTVLVVDDEVEVQLVAKRMLEKAGYDVLSAFDGKQAVELIEKHSADIGCVLMDLMMPKMDGIEAFTEIHGISPTIPIVLTSGFDEGNLIEKLPEHPLAGFIQKPFRMRKLVDAVNGAMRN